MRNAIFAILAAGALFAAMEARHDPAPRRLAAPQTGVDAQLSDAHQAFGNIPLTAR